MLGLRGYIPHIVIGISISLIMVGAYAAVSFASSSSSKALWSTNPITITGGTGQATDSFKCAPPISGTVVLTISNPVALTVTPSTFPSGCGPSFTTITLTAHSTVSTTVTVTIHRVSQYGNAIAPSLVVRIVVH